MHSWAPPSPPKPGRSKFYLWAVLGWLSATAAGYFWLSRDPRTTEDASDRADLPDPLPRQTTTVAETRPARAIPFEPAPTGDIKPPTSKAVDEILPCEEFLQQASEPTDNRLPAHLERSAVGAFIGENNWAKPCRTKQRLTAKLCVAIRDGSVRGLTVRTSPPNLTLENCLREQAAKLVLQPESTLRVIRTTLSL